MTINKPKGTEDLIAADALTWNYLRDVADDLFTVYGYQPVETPMFEQADVFVHGLGTGTDVVRKEMFTTLSPDAYAKVAAGEADALKAAQRLALRPEGTAGVVRAAIEHSLVAQGGAEVIIMFMRYVEALGIDRSSIRLLINSMGDDACRPAYRDSVSAYMHEHLDELCDECKVRADTNPLRAFDCKNERCHEVMEGAPKISDALCDDCRAHYAKVKSYLDAQGIAYVEDPRLVRGLDYYTRTVFEVQVVDGLGAQNAIGGGGRYDELFETAGGKPTPGLGFAAGFERLVLAMQACGATLPEPVRPDAYVAVAEPEVAGAAFALTQELRDNGFIVEADRQGKSLKGQFKQADKYAAPFIVVVGPDELAAGKVKLRDMSSHDERLVALDDVTNVLAEALGYSAGGCGCDCDCDGDCDCGDDCGCGCGCGGDGEKAGDEQVGGAAEKA